MTVHISIPMRIRIAILTGGKRMKPWRVAVPISDKLKEQLGCEECGLCPYPKGYGVPYCVPINMKLEDYLDG